MAQQRATMINPAIEELLDRVDSKFTLVSVSAKRARQINAYFNQLGEGVGHNAPPQVASVSRKPLSIALEELVADKSTSAPMPTHCSLPPLLRQATRQSPKHPPLPKRPEDFSPHTTLRAPCR
jgi:DNA-directed RNA polymerase subunit omega